VGHVTPEALNGGLIGLLETGDLLHVQLKGRRIDLLDPEAFIAGRLIPWSADLRELRRDLGAERIQRIQERRRQVAATNRMHDVTDASQGVVPLVVAQEAARAYQLRTT
jgi:dihydroxy-acid dehydratase